MISILVWATSKLPIQAAAANANRINLLARATDIDRILAPQPTSVGSASLTSLLSSPTSGSSTTSILRYPPHRNSAKVSQLNTSSSTTAVAVVATSGTPNPTTVAPGVTSEVSLSMSSSTAISTASPAADSTEDHRSLIIILAVVFGLLGLSLLYALYVVIKRYRRRQTPFNHRGVSPIDDEEIATWRGSSQPMAQSKPLSSHPPAHHTSHSTVLQHSPGQTWTVHPTHSSAGSDSKPAGKNLPEPPPVARAPNSRSGLTDEAIPGAQPFVTSPKRHSRRLSKSQSSSHMRSKSRRSSISISAMEEQPRTSTSSGLVQSTWTEPEEWRSQRRMTPPRRPSYSKDEADFPLGGLAPPPRRSPSSRGIARAI